MNHRPLITFALFAFNQDQYICEAIAGAFAQTYSPLEIILSDDGSSDRTFEIIERMAKEYQGPHTIITNRNDPNLGIVPHVNKVCIELSHGELIVMAAGDDISLPVRTEILYRCWESSARSVFALQSAVSLINSSGECIQEYHEYGRDPGIFTPPNLHEGLVQIRAHGAAAMYHRSLFDFFGPLQIAKVEDGPLARRACLLGQLFYSADNLVKIRVGDTMSRISNSRRSLFTYADWVIFSCKQVLADVELYQKKNKDKLPQIDVDILIEVCKREVNKQDTMATLAKGKLFSRLIAWSKCRTYSTFSQWIEYFQFVLPEVLSGPYLKILATRRHLRGVKNLLRKA